MNDNILLDNPKYVICIFFDFRKAFETVPHQRLLERLTEIGIHPLLLSWLCNYISERKQHVLVNVEKNFSINSCSFWSFTRLSSRPNIVFTVHIYVCVCVRIECIHVDVELESTSLSQGRIQG